MVEPLEDRRLLAITVDTLSDMVDLNDGVLSLREAIFVANTASGADTINFAPSLTANGPATILLTQGALEISDALSIFGLGADILTIDASGNDPTPNELKGDGSRIFRIDDGNVASTIDVTIRGLRLTGGDVSGDGGAIANLEDLTVDLVTINGNSAANGGGIHNIHGMLVVERSEIRSNFAISFGGGVWTSSELSGSRVEDSMILANRAVSGGGGISVVGDGGLVIVNSTFATNGIDAIRTDSPAGTTQVLYCTIANTIGGYGFRATEVQVIEGSIFTSASAQELNGEFEVNFSLIHNVGSAIITGSNNIFGQSPLLSALADYGGPTRTFGLAAHSPAINAGDTSASAGVAGVPEFDQRGGPYTRVFDGRIDIGAYERQNTGSPLSLEVSTLADELDDDFSTGDLSLREAVMLANANAGFEDTVTFADSLDGGTILLTQGGLVLADATSISAISLPSRITIDASGNDDTPDIVDGRGSQIFRLSGGDSRNHPVLLTLKGLALTGGDSSDAGAISTSDSLRVEDCVIFGNAGFNAGAIETRSYANASVRIERTTLSGNISSHYGGALYLSVDGGIAQIIDCQIVDNIASNHGGGVSASPRNGGIVEIHSSLIANNRVEVDSLSGGEGGGLKVSVGTDGLFRLANSVVTGNSVVGDNVRGGGMLLEVRRGEASVSSSRFENNIASDSDASPIGDGGGMWLYSAELGELTVSSVTVAGNQANGNGGGISAKVRSNSTSFRIEDSTITGNRANGSGGGIALENASGPATAIFTLARSTTTSNTADDDADGVGAGGGVSTLRQILTVEGSIVAGNGDESGTAPDLRPTGVGGAVAIRSSLVGDGINSTLNEAPLGLPDANGNLIGGPTNGVIDPKLGPLVNNGGPTWTHALLPGSPAFNAGDPAAVAGMNGVPEFDQRGAPWSRVVGGRIDIGAVEAQANPLAGDYNFNGVVDAGDYSVWRDTVGSASDWRADGSGAVDGVPDGVVDQLDYLYWRSRLGNVIEQGAGSVEQGELVAVGEAMVVEPAIQPPALKHIHLIAVGS